MFRRYYHRDNALSFQTRANREEEALFVHFWRGVLDALKISGSAHIVKKCRDHPRWFGACPFVGASTQRWTRYATTNVGTLAHELRHRWQWDQGLLILTEAQLLKWQGGDYGETDEPWEDDADAYSLRLAEAYAEAYGLSLDTDPNYIT